jgi:hypothetical protein
MARSWSWPSGGHSGDTGRRADHGKAYSGACLFLGLNLLLGLDQRRRSNGEVGTRLLVAALAPHGCDVVLLLRHREIVQRRLRGTSGKQRDRHGARQGASGFPHD